MAAPRSRMLDLLKAQCRIFSHNFNPQNLRLGNKILRQRLRGAALAAYYPRKSVTFRDLEDAYRPMGLETFDPEKLFHEEMSQMYDLLDPTHTYDLWGRKSRGKGPPKKKRTAAGTNHLYLTHMSSAIRSTPVPKLHGKKLLVKIGEEEEIQLMITALILYCILYGFVLTGNFIAFGIG
ncbi:hypothetical protein FQN49_007465 [Arthroderma sp. PD_2]|nr:hypothetical protein FQN49_007465 [Arthroderma sp. PD_2]